MENDLASAGPRFEDGLDVSELSNEQRLARIAEIYADVDATGRKITEDELSAILALATMRKPTERQ